MPDLHGGYQERTEEPSSQRREEARAEGNLPVSPELVTLFAVLGGAAVLYFAAMPMASGISSLMERALTDIDREITLETAPGIIRGAGSALFIIILPALAIPLAGAAASFLQSGMVFSTKAVEPGFGEMDPVAGLRRLFSGASVVELARFAVKVSAVGYVAYRAVAREAAVLPALMDTDAAVSLAFIAGAAFRVMISTLSVFLVIGVADYALARWFYERGLRMTRDEAAGEARRDEASPAVRARMRSMHRDAAAGRTGGGRTPDEGRKEK